MLFIGITGGVGAGKSRILDYIRENYPCEIYLADQVAHRVKQPGTKAYEELVCLLGPEAVGRDGEIDKGVMAEKIFAEPSLLKRVNDIVHPAVKEFLLERLALARRPGGPAFFFVEAALLIEGGYLALVDEMWYLYANEEVRRARLAASRGYSRERIRGIMSSQLTEEQFRENCSFVIDNSGDFESSCRQVDERLAGVIVQNDID